MAIFGSSKKDRAREQQAHELALQKQQQEWNVEMWNMQNEYNTPANQMARYQEAGLNPNMIYGQIGNGNAGQVPTYERAHAVRKPSTGEVLLDSMAPILQFAKGFEELKQANAQTNLLNTQATFVEEQRRKVANEVNYTHWRALNEEFRNKEYSALLPYIDANAEYKSNILSSQSHKAVMEMPYHHVNAYTSAKQSEKQLAIMDETILSKQFDRIIRRMEHDLATKRFSFEQRSFVQRQLQDMRKFNAELKYKADTFNADYNLRDSHHQDRLWWDKFRYVTEFFDPLRWLNRNKVSKSFGF